MSGDRHLKPWLARIAKRSRLLAALVVTVGAPVALVYDVWMDGVPEGLSEWREDVFGTLHYLANGGPE